MFSVVPYVRLSVTIDTTDCVDTVFWLVRLKPDLIQTTTDKTSLPQPKTDDISFDKSLLLQCRGIHGHYVPLVDIAV